MFVLQKLTIAMITSDGQQNYSKNNIVCHDQPKHF